MHREPDDYQTHTFLCIGECFKMHWTIITHCILCTVAALCSRSWNHVGLINTWLECSISLNPALSRRAQGKGPRMKSEYGFLNLNQSFLKRLESFYLWTGSTKQYLFLTVLLHRHVGGSFNNNLTDTLDIKIGLVLDSLDTRINLYSEFLLLYFNVGHSFAVATVNVYFSIGHWRLLYKPTWNGARVFVTRGNDRRSFLGYHTMMILMVSIEWLPQATLCIC